MLLRAKAGQLQRLRSCWFRQLDLHEYLLRPLGPIMELVIPNVYLVQLDPVRRHMQWIDFT